MKALLSRATIASLLLGTSLLASAADLPRTPAPEGAEVFIVSPQDGATVGQTFTVKFGVKKLDLELSACFTKLKAINGKAQVKRVSMPAGQPGSIMHPATVCVQ